MELPVLLYCKFKFLYEIKEVSRTSDSFTSGQFSFELTHFCHPDAKGLSKICDKSVAANRKRVKTLMSIGGDG